MTAPSSRRKWLIAGAVAVAVLVVGLVLLNKAVCFEGSCGPIVVTTTTWTWDGGRWSSGMRQVAVGGSLDYNRENLAFDPATGHLVLVAILPDDSQTQGGATWTWSGSGWTRIHSGTGPDFPGPLVYNGQTRRLLMFTDAGVFAWSGKDWLHEKGSSAPGVGEPLAYDPDVSSVVSVS
ncbi:MAG TPA: hypothetical protein VHQ03_10100, partial [Candidatus Dormibacteraeota bacterium]|nr:hypothetical protein [Candidatus Dormibacteraeota bacterium]